MFFGVLGAVSYDEARAIVRTAMDAVCSGSCPLFNDGADSDTFREAVRKRTNTGIPQTVMTSQGGGVAVAHTPGMTVARTPWVIWGLSVATLLFEGYDFYVYGATVPFLLRPDDWALDPRFAGAIGTGSGAGC